VVEFQKRDELDSGSTAAFAEVFKRPAHQTKGICWILNQLPQQGAQEAEKLIQPDETWLYDKFSSLFTLRFTSPVNFSTIVPTGT